MILNREKGNWSKILPMQAQSEGCEAESEERQWHYLAVKKL